MIIGRSMVFSFAISVLVLSEFITMGGFGEKMLFVELKYLIFMGS